MLAIDIQDVACLTPKVKEDTMGCATCANNTTDGKPNGCQSNGDCGSGGCERMSVFDWLNDIELPVGSDQFDCIEVSFKNGRKQFYRNKKNVTTFTGDTVTVEGNPGFDVGVVTLTGELVKHQMNRKGVDYKSSEIKRVQRKSSDTDLEKWREARGLEYETMHKARTMASDLGLQMKLGDVEYQGDKSKAIFYYTAEDRVDFRELIKVMADTFRIRIEMKQIGARQEAGRLGGLGACGRELCCSTWLTDFRSVSTGAARYQQLSLNPQKLAGQCGKLKCCLNFELDQYMDELKGFPNARTVLETKAGRAVHIKTDVFKHMMWYLIEKEKGQNAIVAVNRKRALEIIEMNKDGKTPEDLTDFSDIPKVEEKPDYSNVVGQDDLNRFDNVFKKKKKKKKKKRPQGGQKETTNVSNSNKNENKGGGQNRNKNKNQNKNRNQNRNKNQKQNND